jgi:hypothetical protein
LFTVNGWSSALWDDRTEENNTFNDFLGISEANLGINKANYFIKRSVSQVVNIDDKGGVTSSVTVAYKNTDTSGRWPGGEYKNYLRFILPLNSQLIGIKINGQDKGVADAITDPQVYENKSFTPLPKTEVEKYVQSGKAVFGILVNVPVNGLVTVNLNYSIPSQILVSAPVINYSLRVFKQPGTDEYPYDLSLTYPSGYKIQSVSTGQENNGRFVYSASLNGDLNLSVGLTKQ